MNWQMITGISSVIIALCAIIISICQGSAIRRHHRMSVKPHLTTWRHLDPVKGYYQFELINNGIGPALIEKFCVKVDGKVLIGTELDVIETAVKMLFPNTKYVLDKAYVGKGYAMAPKERCKIVSIQFQGGIITSKETVDDVILKRAALDITYTSFYGEVFKLETDKLNV